MKIKLLFTMLGLTISSLTNAQTWNTIRNNAVPNLILTNEFEQPYVQPMATDGFEDGVYISRDGLRLYSSYEPLDLINYFDDWSKQTPFTGVMSVAPYIRASLLNIDTTSNPFVNGASWMHSDIVLSTRIDTSLPFSTWSSTAMARPTTSETAPQMIDNGSGGASYLVYGVDSVFSKRQLFLQQNTSFAPVLSGSVLPPSINDTNFFEDNPHIEQLTPDSLVLIYERQDKLNESNSDILFSIGTNSGTTWSTPQLISSILNTHPTAQHPHLWFDGVIWWLYFSAVDSTTSVRSIYRAKQMSTIPDWKNGWTNIEMVVGNGTVTGGGATIIAYGEPTLTSWGDLSFVVLYEKTNPSDSTDVFDLDPWYMKTKNPISMGVNEDINKEFDVEIYPNPANNFVTISNSSNEKISIQLINTLGKVIKRVETVDNNYKLSIENLPVGLYFLQIRTSDNRMVTKKLIKN